MGSRTIFGVTGMLLLKRDRLPLALGALAAAALTIAALVASTANAAPRGTVSLVASVGEEAPASEGSTTVKSR